MENLHPFSFLRSILIPIVLWIAFTPFSGQVDLQTSYFFYDKGAFSTSPLWSGIYFYGLWPSWIMMGIALTGLFFSCRPRFREWRKPCLYLILTFAVGSGVIIEGGFKRHWERPRPRQIVEFGGYKKFHPYYCPADPLSEPSKSFPSGHASSGFCFFALMILGKIYRCPRLYWGGMGLAWGLGALLSLARIAQGGHFLSDTLAAALIMWLTACVLAFLLFPFQRLRYRRGDK